MVPIARIFVLCSTLIVVQPALADEVDAPAPVPSARPLPPPPPSPEAKKAEPQADPGRLRLNIAAGAGYAGEVIPVGAVAGSSSSSGSSVNYASASGAGLLLQAQVVIQDVHIGLFCLISPQSYTLSIPASGSIPAISGSADFNLGVYEFELAKDFADSGFFKAFYYGVKLGMATMSSSTGSVTVGSVSVSAGGGGTSNSFVLSPGFGMDIQALPNFSLGFDVSVHEFPGFNDGNKHFTMGFSTIATARYWFDLRSI